MTLALTLALALVAGMSIPAGALMSSRVSLRSICLQHDIDSFVSYFGGGALLAAIALVLLPYGIQHVSVLAGELKHLAHETLILWAENDVFQKPAYASKLQQTIPNAKLIWIKDAGHWLMEEKPEEVSGHLLAFLDREYPVKWIRGKVKK